jgi:ABC-2 type transport system permease protein
MIPDADMISEMFFDFRRQGVADFNFDNVTFALNCIDVLAGDESFVTLRKHRPMHRTLARVEEQSRIYDEQRQKETEAAETRAADQLAEARGRLSEKVLAVQERKDLDDQAKAIMIRNIQNVENRRLQVVESTINREKEQSLAAARSEMEQGVAHIQGAIKLWAAGIPPVPTFLLAIGMFAYRRKREKISAAERTLVEESR